jgi:hypothetical protein
MKMALSEFALREKGIYGVLHIVILLLSLFLVVSISVDTFKGIPFYTQTVFMGRMDVFRRNHLLIAFYSFSARRLCIGHCGGVVDV